MKAAPTEERLAEIEDGSPDDDANQAGTAVASTIRRSIPSAVEHIL
jgi:hypothetical protein